MRIAVVSLPLHTNYGGLLQSFALKKYLESHGHDVTVLDIRDKMPLPKWWKSPLVYTKRAVMRLLKGTDGPEIFREIRFRREYPVVSVFLQTIHTVSARIYWEEELICLQKQIP